MSVTIKYTTGNLKKLADKYKKGTTVLDVGFLTAESASIARKNEFGGVYPTTDRYKSRAKTKGINLPDFIKIPPRPFMRMTYDDYKTKWIKLVKTMLTKDFNFDKTARILGEESKADIQNTIITGDFIANSARTIAIKEKSSPLIDTGEMLKSVDYSVTKK